MFNFGSIPIRELESFGVAGLLGPEAEVFYYSIFNTKQIGRVSDLLLARIKKTGVDEVRFRALLILLSYEAFQSQTKKKGILRTFFGDQDGSLDHPIVLECGVDAEKIVLGVSFSPRADLKIQIGGISQRVFHRQTKVPFELMLTQIQDQSHRLVFKNLRTAKRIEIAAFLGIPGRIEPFELEQKEPMEVVLFLKNPKKTPAPRIYTELGDTDHPNLLRESDFEKQVVRASPTEPVEQQILPGSSIEENDVFHVHGANGDLSDQEAIVVSGKAQSEGGFSFKNFLGKLFSNRSTDEKIDDKIAEGSAELNSSTEKMPLEYSSVSLEQLETKNIDIDAMIQLGNDTNLQEQVDRLLSDLSSGVEAKNLNNIEQELTKLKKEIRPSQAYVQVETLVRNMAQERIQLQELAKKLAKNTERKVNEVKNSELSIKETLEKKEAELIQKMRELAQQSEMYEKLKTEEAHFKKRYALSNRLLTLTKEENAKLTHKLRELKTELESNAVPHPQAGSTSEYTNLLTKYEQLFRQADEFKKTNRLLMQRIKSAEQNAVDPSQSGIQEMSQRLEASAKLAATKDKEKEAMKEKAILHQKQELRLKVEINRLRGEIKNLKDKLGDRSSSAA